MDEQLRRSERIAETATAMEFGGGNGALRTTVTHEDDDDDFSGNSASPANPATSVGAPSTAKTSAARCKSRVAEEDNWRRSLDLQDEDFETDISAHIHGSFSRETTPTSSLHGDTDDEAEMESSSAAAAKNNSGEVNRRGGKPAAGNRPPTAEIEEFFATAEKYEQKRFEEKYNYDIVKDVALEGRYQWVRLKP